jgi:hypothetical protein
MRSLLGAGKVPLRAVTLASAPGDGRVCDRDPLLEATVAWTGSKLVRSSSHAAKHWRCTWWLPRSRPSSSRVNSSSNSASSCPAGLPQIVQQVPTPGPPQMRWGKRLGSLPACIASRAFFLSVLSSLIQLTLVKTDMRSAWQPIRRQPGSFGFMKGKKSRNLQRSDFRRAARFETLASGWQAPVLCIAKHCWRVAVEAL